MASGPTLVRLEKPQPADGTTRIEATPATGAEISNHDTENDRVGEPTDAHAVIPPSDAEPAAADAKSSRWEKSNWWESFAYGSIAGLLLRLAALAIVMLQNWMRETARKHRPLDAWSGLIEASPEPRVGDGEATPRALSPEAALVRIEAIRRSLVARPRLPRGLCWTGKWLQWGHRRTARWGLGYAIEHSVALWHEGRGCRSADIKAAVSTSAHERAAIMALDKPITGIRWSYGHLE